MRKKKQKKILISLISVLLVAAMGAGTYYGITHSKSDPIPVIGFMEVGMTEYWGDNMESHGPVSSDNIQTVFLSDTQQVTEVLVKEGDTVKKGDPLMTFDTTLSGLDLERKRLEVEKLKLDLLDEEDNLRQIMSMRPMQTPPPMEDFEPPAPDLGQELVTAYRISGKREFDGSAADQPLIVWLRGDTVIDSAMIQDILKFSLDLQVENTFFPDSSPSALDSQPETEAAVESLPLTETKPAETTSPETVETEPAGTVPETTDHAETEPQWILGVVRDKSLDVYEKHNLKSDVVETLGWGTSVMVFDRWESKAGVQWAFIRCNQVEGWVLRDGLSIEGEPDPTEPQETEPAETEPQETEPEEKPTDPKPVEPTDPRPQPEDLGSCYAIFKITQDNMSKGARTLWQGFKIRRAGAFSFFDASSIPDYTMAADLEDEEEDHFPDFDFGSGLTFSQIAELRVEQEKKIEECKLKIKMAETEYKIKKRELEDGNIYAEFDGKVVSLLTEEESRQMKKPMIKVSGGGGFQVEGSVGELDREKMQIGQKVTVNDWNSGGTYEGEIISIGDFPIRGRGYNGRGNPNSSYYPFVAFVDGEADLQAGSYVSIQYNAGGENGIYLSNPFIRTEKGQSYVYVMDENETLRKQPVTTGKALWGSYTEITSGITEEDYLAFPYGKNVKSGAKAVIGDISDFYG